MHDFDRITQEDVSSSYGLEIPDSAFEDELFSSEQGDESQLGELTDDNEEAALASELLSSSTDQELDQFLGGLLKKAARRFGRFIPRGVGRFALNALKKVASRALPVAGGSLGNVLLPGVGGAFGSKLAGSAGSLFGLEVEGLSSEDQEFEVARRIVRLTNAVGHNIAQGTQDGNPAEIARNALVAAAHSHAPGLITVPAETGGLSQSGRWFRTGDRIVLHGV